MLKRSLAFLISLPLLAASDVLIVTDEPQLMDALAKQLKERAGVSVTVNSQSDMPADLSVFPTVIVSIRNALAEPAENAFINYAKGGGKLMLLHSSISQEKRNNKNWFPFFDLILPGGEIVAGGYKALQPASCRIVNVAGNKHPITGRNVDYPDKTGFQMNGMMRERELPSFTLVDTEVEVNPMLSGPRTTLLGLKITDIKSGMLVMQGTAGWYKQTEKGMVMYFMPGYQASDFENAAYAQILANAVKFPVGGK
jgi:type 1 glutamine amidotransferase